MTKKSTGNKQGQRAFALLQEWRGQGVPDLITSYEAFNLTDGKVGKSNSSQAMRLIEVALKAIKNGGVK